ncbi:ATP-binding protein [Egbenema bharatensis]|uniref:ATP-binding protein n=1 Tax=Egbenema bharatensis TaxID=3463334 RepID=UPI003A8897C0
MSLGAIQISVRNSIGTRLFLYVLCGALLGLSSMSYLFYQVLESQVRAEMVSHLETQAALVEGQLSRVEQLLSDSVTTIEVLHEAKTIDADSYRETMFELYQNRPPIALGAGAAQAPFQLAPDRSLYYPYFFLDQHTPDQVGQPLPAPHSDTRFVDIAQLEDYTQKPYYHTPVETQSAVWLEPYAWNDITMTSLVAPMYGKSSSSDDNPLLGFMGVDISVTALSQQMSLSLFKDSGYLTIISDQGNLLAYPPDPQQAKSLATYQDIPQLNAVSPHISTDPSGLIQSNGMYWAYQRVQGTHWLMLEVVPQWVILQPVLLIAFGASIGAGGILAVVVSFFIRRLNQRLRPILDQCDALIETDIDRIERLNLQNIDPTVVESQLALSVQNKDELDILELLIQHMAEQLQTSFEELEQRVADRTEALSTTLTQLKQSQLQLVQNEKMSSLGQLVAGVAHEINNPVNFIHGNVSHVDTYARDLLNLVHLYDKHFPEPPPAIQAEIEAIDLKFLEADLEKALQSMLIGTDRIREIVQSLRNFSRLDESEVKDVDIHEGIDSTITILQNRLKAKGDRPSIQIIKEYGILPLVECYAGQLNQVFMNLLSNAIDALEERDRLRSIEEIKAEPSTIRIWSGKVRNRIAIHISDNGTGMSEAVRSQIFDPFFTTKPVGKGTGMGLSISYQIVTDRHNGRLWCESTPGKGTKFIIEIPTRQSAVPLVGEEYIAGVAF